MTAALEAFAIAGELRERARRAAFAVGERLLEAMDRPEEDAYEQWVPSRHLNGSAGYAIAFAALAQASGDARYEAAMHAQLRAAATLEDVPGLGLLDGISGLRAAAAIASGIEPRYRRLVEQCDAFVEERLPRVGTIPQTCCDFDVITGWSGIRLARCVDGPREGDRLTALLEWTIASERRWCLPHPYTNDVENDLGLSHGIPGMLAALALTLRGASADTIDLVRTRAWELAQRVIDADGVPAWSHAIQAEPREHYRAAWCYGAAGVGAALHAIGRFVRDDALERFALAAVERLASQPTSAWYIENEAICHGTVGNALAIASVAAAAESPVCRAAVERVVLETIDLLEAGDYRTFVWNKDASEQYASFGELTGSAGIALTLLTLGGDAGAAWMRCHALRPIA